MLRAALPAMVALGLLGCADTQTTDAPISLRFSALANGEAVACGQRYSLGSPPVAAEIADLRFYVHDVRLVTAAGDEVLVALDDDGLWQDGEVALLDFEDKTGACATGTAETRAVVTGTAPEGQYVGVAFTVGVPEALNHLDVATAASPLNLTSMFWSWTGGYKFLRLDVETDAGGWLFHVGSTGCGGSPATGIACTEANRSEVRVTGITPGVDAVALDLDALLADTAFGEGHPGCHAAADEPDCAAVMPRLGLALDGGAAPSQTVFAAAP